VSSWTLILLTSERLISVWLPFKCKELCSRRRIIVVWIVISLLLFGANMHFFFTFDLYAIPGGNGSDIELSCDLHAQFEEFFIGPWYYIDALLGDFIPFSVVFFGNCAIIFKIYASKRLRDVAAKDDKGSRKVQLRAAIIISIVCNDSQKSNRNLKTTLMQKDSTKLHETKLIAVFATVALVTFFGPRR